MHEVERFTEDGWSVTLYYDEDGDACNPRDYDNLGVLACAHRCYDLGDTPRYRINAEDYNGWNDVRDALTERHGPLALIEPVYMLDHSGTALSFTAFTDRWDSGQVGWCFVSVEKMQAEYGTDWLEHLTQARERITAELEEYSKWCNGEVYGYIVRTPEGEAGDSCWGYIGREYAEQEAKCAMESAIKEHLRTQRQLDALVNRGFAL
jgi:hypothetical protein